ncbi:MAG: GspE/PulE family protein [Pseudomonadota bacterium]
MLPATTETSSIEALVVSLSESGALSEDARRRAERVATETGERLDKVMLRLGIVSERVMADAAAELLGMDRTGKAFFPDTPPFAETLGYSFLSNARVLPLLCEQGRLRLAVADPYEPAAAQAIAMKLGVTVEPAIALPSEIEEALERLRAPTADYSSTQDTSNAAGDVAEDIARLRDAASEAPVIRLVNQLIRRAVEARASDIHLEPEEHALRVRLRIDGTLTETEAPAAHLRAAVLSRIKIMAKLNIAEQRLPQDGRIKAVVAGREVDMRVATLPTLHGEGAVLRLLDRSGLALDFEGLGFDRMTVNSLERLMARPNGIVLVTGPTGSGKTTTLYAMLSRLNAVARKIVTIEDPVEYQLSGITQIQVKPQIGLSFAQGLRAILRQDPDVIMIGEIRDRETAEIAVQAALTGHLVLATLHTNSAAAGIDRLRDMGIEDYLVSATLAGSVAQRLVRKLCPDCAGQESAALAARLAPGLPAESFRSPQGCSACRGTGFLGRTSVIEVLEVDEGVREAILARLDHRQIARIAATDGGMRSMYAHGIEKAAAGETSLGEVLSIGELPVAQTTPITPLAKGL